MKILSLLGLSVISCISLSAQVKDTAEVPKRSFEASMFANDDTLTRSDYLLSLQKVFQLLNKASTLAQPVPAIISMSGQMDEDDSVLYIIKDRLSSNDRALNVRNLQMFNILLRQIKTDTKNHAKQLNQYDSILDSTKMEIFDLRKDTVIRHIFRDSVLKAYFKPQLQQLRLKWKKADSLIKYVNILIDNTLAHSSGNLIITS